MKCSRILSLLLALAACRSAAPPTESVPYEVLAQGVHSGEERAGATLITSRADWQAFWRRHSAWRIPAEPEPEVDFAMHSVLVVCAGDEPSAGWAIETLSIAREGERLLVRAALRAPPADALQAQLRTRPFQILLVPRTSGTAVLELDQRRSTR